MKISLSELEPFKEICRKICLNIPVSYSWHWDRERNMAAVVLEEEDAEMVFYPLFKEFRNHWNFASIEEASGAVNAYISSSYGLMPGQVIFTSHKVSNLILAVAWWPWGSEDRVSMRVGLIPIDFKMNDEFAFQCLSRWLKITADEK